MFISDSNPIQHVACHYTVPPKNAQGLTSCNLAKT